MKTWLRILAWASSFVLSGVSFAQTYSESFDTYATNSLVIGQGGWTGWDNGSSTNARVVGGFAVSQPHSLRSTEDTNVVRSLTGFTSGRWVFRAMQYVPSTSQGDSVLALFNRYVVNDHPSSDWSVELLANADSNTIRNVQNGDSAPLVEDEWVEIRCEIDLAINHVAVYYNGALLTSSAWTTGGLLSFRAIQVLALDPTSVAYYDDISVRPPGLLESLAPHAEEFLRGQAIGGNLASWASADNDPRVVRKFLTLNPAEAPIRINLDFATSIAAPSQIAIETMARSLDAGSYSVSLALKNQGTGLYETVLGESTLDTVYRTFRGNATGDLQRFLAPGNVVTAQIVVRQTGPSTASLPRFAFESASLSVGQ